MTALTLDQKKEELRTFMEKWQLGVSVIIDGVDDSAKKCWVINGENCPYGNPNGKFAEAPLDACKGCHIAGNYETEFKDLLGLEEKAQLEEEELKQGIREDISLSSISVKDLLNKLAEEACSGKAQKELKKILKEFIEVVSRELKLEQKMVVEEDEVLSSKEQEVKNEK